MAASPPIALLFLLYFANSGVAEMILCSMSKSDGIYSAGDTEGRTKLCLHGCSLRIEEGMAITVALSLKIADGRRTRLPMAFGASCRYGYCQ